uniref:Uncharacterized protein n=2 Tax=Salix viminalis TaxID=40686 RepID=A0A6N2MNX3_SALVM
MRDAFSEALGSLLALGMNPEAQVQPRGKGPFPPAKKLEGGLQRHLALPFTKGCGYLYDGLDSLEWNSIEGCENWHNLIMGLLFIGNSSKVSASR